MAAPAATADRVLRKWPVLTRPALAGFAARPPTPAVVVEAAAPRLGLPRTICSMPLSEADTHAKLVNPAIYARGWTEDHIKRDETTGAADIVAGKARRRAKRRTDLTLRVIVTAEMQPVAGAVIASPAKPRPRLRRSRTLFTTSRPSTPTRRPRWTRGHLLSSST